MKGNTTDIGEPKLTDVQPLGSSTPQRRDASKERSLAMVREAHHSALVVVATLEGEIEQLSCPLIWSQSETWTHSHSRDCHRHRSRGWKRRHCQVWPEDCCAPYFKYNPYQGSLEPRGEEAATEDLNLGSCWNWCWRSPISSGGQLRVWGGRHEGTLPQTPNRRPMEVGNLGGPDVQNTQLVARVNHGG